MYDSKTDIEIPREKVLAGGKAEMLSGRNSSTQSGRTTPEARKHEECQIAAFGRKRDDNHASTSALKVARMLISRAATGSRARQRVLGIHDIRVAFHAPVEEETGALAAWSL